MDTKLDKKESVTVAELLSVKKSVQEEIKVTTPNMGQATTEVRLGNSEMSPSSWRILPIDNDTIEATCGGHLFRGTSKQFSAMLRAGKYMK